MSKNNSMFFPTVCMVTKKKILYLNSTTGKMIIILLVPNIIPMGWSCDYYNYLAFVKRKH